MNTRYTSSDFASSQIEPNEKFIGAMDYNNQLNEQWLGLGVGYRVNDYLSVGGTLFISYRAQSYQMTDYIRVVYLDSTNLFGSFNDDRTLKYKTFSGLFKFGAAYQTGNWKFGLTVTTPSIQVYGSGDIQREISLIALADTLEGAGVVIMGRKSGIHATYKRPLSVGLGVEYNSAKTRIALSCEYFTRIKIYHLFEPQSDPFVYPPSADTGATHAELESFLHVEDASHPVCNIGIGFSQDLGSKFTLMLGARTDFSSYSNPGEGDIYLHNSSSWDLYHFSAGLSYHQKRNTITAGFTYSVSPAKSIDQLGVWSPVNYTTNPVLYAQSFALVIGYTYYFPK
jgi:hypothetical protein